LPKDLFLSYKLITKLEKEIKRLNKKGYVHMDIMPKNILVKYDEKQNIKDVTLSDFGLTEKEDNISQRTISTFYRYFKYFNFTNQIFKVVPQIKAMKDPSVFDQALLYTLKMIPESLATLPRNEFQFEIDRVIVPYKIYVTKNNTILQVFDNKKEYELEVKRNKALHLVGISLRIKTSYCYKEACFIEYENSQNLGDEIIYKDAYDEGSEASVGIRNYIKKYNISDKLKSKLTILHDDNYIFGKIELSNIVYDESSKEVYLIGLNTIKGKEDEEKIRECYDDIIRHSNVGLYFESRDEMLSDPKQIDLAFIMYLNKL
jgi:tRNA A-37 threonylcarbamoyl transferase component Bud32